MKKDLIEELKKHIEEIRKQEQVKTGDKIDFEYQPSIDEFILFNYYNILTSNLFRVIESGLQGDKEKVREYTNHIIIVFDNFGDRYIPEICARLLESSN